MRNEIPKYLLKYEVESNEVYVKDKAKLSFIDKTLKLSAKAFRAIFVQQEYSGAENFVNRTNPSVKLFALVYLVVIVSLVNDVIAQAFFSLLPFIVILFTKIGVYKFYKRIFLLSFFFGFLVAIPASLNIVTKGKIIFEIISLQEPVNFWIYHIPANIGLTVEGCKIVLLLFLRVFNSISISLLIIYTTPFHELIKSLKIIKVPNSFLMIIMLTYKYIFIMTKTIEDTYSAIRSRLIGGVKNKVLRNIVSGRVYFIYKKSVINYETTYFAMLSRGYQGDVKIVLTKKFEMKDIIVLIITVIIGISLIFYDKWLKLLG